MTGEIVNLNRARKVKARDGREAQAAANRVAFGRTGAEKKADQVARDRRERTLDGAKRED